MIPPLAQWPPELYFLYCERAAIREHDGGATREVAESAAMVEVWGRFGVVRQGSLYA